MPREYRPLAVSFGAVNASGELVFNTIKGEVAIATFVTELTRFLSLCNGIRTIDEVRKEAGLSEEVFDALFDACEQNKILVESRHVFDLTHAASSNPQVYFTDLSPEEIHELVENPEPMPKGKSISLEPQGPSSFSQLVPLFSKRKTTRELLNIWLDREKLYGLLASTLGAGKTKSIPSAGALYPQEVYVVVNTGQPVPQGLYRYDPTSVSLITLMEGEEACKRCFEAIDHPEGFEYSVVIFLAADLGRVSSKYSNRGYRYAFIEAGHAAQNVALFCAEEMLGVLEYGGFRDDLAATMLGLAYPKVPLLALLIGGLPGSPGVGNEKLAVTLKKELVGPDKALKSLQVGVIKNKPEDYGLWMAQVSYTARDGRTELAHGSAETRALSVIKALAEGHERFVSGIVRYDTKDKAVNLDRPWLDPRVLAPLEEWQYKYEPTIGRFDEDLVIEWIVGKRYTGSEVYVPLDFVVYPFPTEFGRKPVCLASSNGVAAHTSWDQAKLGALLELIERDALMVSWITRRPLFSIPVQYAYPRLYDKVKYWRERGRQVKFVDLTLDGPPVVLAVIHSDQYPAFTAGCSASLNVGVACEKALQEAECGLLHALNRPQAKLIDNPEDVKTIQQHEEFYFHPGERLSELSWIIGAKEYDFEECHWDHNPDLHLYDPVFVDLTPEGSPLNVVKAVSEHLVPISFGYGTEHVAHRRFKMLNFDKWVQRPKFPHFFS